MASGCSPRSAAAAGAFSRLKPEIYTTTDGKVIVEDEILNFIVIKMRTLSHDEIVLLVTSSFSSERIEAAKKTLFAVCPNTTQRCTAFKGQQKDNNNVKLCLKVINECGQDIPRFVSHFLDDLPPVSFNNMDVSVLLGRMEQLNSEICLMKRTLESQGNACESLREVMVTIDDRLTAVERPLRSESGPVPGAGADRPKTAAAFGRSSSGHTPNQRQTTATALEPGTSSQSPTTWSTMVKAASSSFFPGSDSRMSAVPRVRLSGGLEVCRVLNGMWQVSGAHGAVDHAKAVEAMQAYVDAGLTTFDMADIYGPAEEIFGQFNNQRKSSGNDVPTLQGLTKYVPRPGPMDRKVVEKVLRRSMSRMQVESLDCVQFHWWDYRDKRYLDALGHLADLQQEGLIRELALTNFDTQRLEEITNRGIRISSNQVQYSLIDQRPAAKMEQFCLANNIQLLTYGTLAGGLLSERYLGKTEPNSRAELYTASLSKYKNMIDSWGGWSLFQDLLVALETAARRHDCSVASVATRYVLDRPAVGGVIVGCRLGVAGAGQHISDSLRSCSPDLKLTTEDLAAIEAVTGRSRDLMALIGDCGDEYRR